MKKNLFFMAAAAAFVLSACTSEEEALLPVGPQNTAANDGAVRFDTYLNSGTNSQTRAGEEEDATPYKGEGPFTNSHLKNDGFGVFASWHNESYDKDNGADLNFMYDQKITFDEGEGVWTYTPLVYWPNQTAKLGDESAEEGTTDGATGNTALAGELNKVSFFAYAPYYAVREGGGAGLAKNNGNIFAEDEEGNVAKKKVGITAIVPNNEAVVPSITYVASKTPKGAEDLLWGVAPYGGLKYTAVNGDQINRLYGESLIDLEKPDVNTKIKFLFQHALTGLRMSILAQVDAKTTTTEEDDTDNISEDEDEQTRISVNYITITPEDEDDTDAQFATSGTLSLLNEKANLPNWEVDGSESGLVIAARSALEKGQSEILSDISVSDLTDIDFYLNPELFVGQNENGNYNFNKRGVTRKEKSVFANDELVDEDAIAEDDAAYSSTGSGMVMFIPVLGEGVSFDNAGALKVRVTVNYDIITKNPNIAGGYVVVPNKISKIVSLSKFRNGRIYNLKLILGLTSVKVEAEAIDWTESGQEVDLPRNLD